jgi:HAD superfamily hydrolase (TIGR01509 family)
LRAGYYEAVVFDMDGVLADSEPVYYAAARAVLAPLGKEMTPAHQRAVMGRSIEDTWAYLARELDLGHRVPELAHAYDLSLRALLAEVREPLPGVREVIAELRNRGIPLAVASSSLPEWIAALLGGVGLTGAFDVAVSAREAAHPKPAPDVYLLAAQRLCVAPERCVAFEDTPTGLASAKAAGMLSVQVRASSTAFPPLEAADVVIGSLAEFDLSLLLP